MKNKLKIILLTIICILAMPIIVNADMGAPESYQYEVIVTNPNGAPLYDWDGEKTGDVIPFDTKIRIGLEYTINGELYVDIYYDDASGYGELEGMIKFSDAKLYSEEIDFSELSPNEDKHQYYAIEDTELYKGPSTVYGKIENVKIPAGTTIDYTYSSDYDYNMWAYTEYNGTKGWIYTFSMQSMSPYDIKSTVVSVSKGKVLVIGDQDVRDHKGNVVGKVKDYEEYEYIYTRSLEPKTSQYYIKSDKIEGWIGASFFGPMTNGATGYYKEQFLVIDKDGLELYEDYKLTKKVKDLKIPYGTEYETYYYVGSTLEETDEYDEEKIITSYQLEYNGKKYWIEYDYEEEDSLYYSSDYTINLVEEQKMYKYDDEGEALDITIPAGTTLVTKWSMSKDDQPTIKWYYVEYEGTKGWIYIDSSISETEVEEETKPTEEPEEEITEEEPTEKKEEKSLTPKQTAIIAISAAALLGVGALVTILLINKKKKTKQQEEKETTHVNNEEPKEEKDKE